MRRSITGPLILLLIGCLFLWRNLHPELPVFDLVAQYWPFLLIVWGLMRLIEALLWRNGSGDNRVRGGGFSGGEVVLVIFVCMIGLGAWQAKEFGIHFNPRGLDIFGEEYNYPVSATAPAAGMKRLVFENSRGNIHVIGGDGQQVTVSGQKSIRAYGRADADRASQNTPIEILPQGDRLVIRTNQDRATGNQRISDDLEVTVPRGMAVESRGNVGDADVSDIESDVELASNRGDVRISRIGGNARLEIGRSDNISAVDVKGKIDLEGHGGDLSLENISGPVTVNGSYSGTLEFKNLAKPLQFEGMRGTEMHVEAIPGRISMDLSTLTGNGVVGPMRFVARSRDVRLEQFSQAVEINTDRGDIELQPGTTPLGTIEARSGVGAIELALPAKATFQLQATAERGDAVNEYGPPIDKEVDRRTATLKGKVGDGPAITLTANHGTVTVRKQGADGAQPGKSLKDSEVKM
jgi:DUF4097 and DUF4098 domain-containing protein YvlB